MDEYIERLALEGAFDAATMAFLEKEDNLFDRKSVLAGMSIAAGIVHTVPAADVARVIHGRWKYYKKKGIAVCAECSFERKLDEDFGRAICCPNCGAKMDLE